MISFKEFIIESEYLQKAENAILAGDYETAQKHLKQHQPGKSRAKDALAAKLALSIKKHLKRKQNDLVQRIHH